METYQTVYDLARLFRTAAEAGVSQAEMARRAHVHPLTVTRLKRGHCTPRFETVDRIARSVGLRAKTLVVGARLRPRGDQS
jgi:transcriptional regulator with XRE-family HTH domain